MLKYKFYGEYVLNIWDCSSTIILSAEILWETDSYVFLESAQWAWANWAQVRNFC
jgi:hypothetical protein